VNNLCKYCGTECPGTYCESCEYMTTPDARAKLHISLSTYFRWLKEGKINPRRIGPRKRLVSRAEIDSLLEKEK
jgi:excisionase family DNA binding protein